MILTHVFAEGFRCFGRANPLQIELRPGINLFVGENDSGKTAVVDAIRVALGTRADDFVRLTEDDFHISPEGRADELVIRCTLDGLDQVELRRFIEWCVLEGGRPMLHVHVRCRLQRTRGDGRRVSTEHRAGREGDGLAIDGELREYLRVAYLRPLRDAERQLRPGRRSRLSQILAALPQMDGQGDPARTVEGDKTLGAALHQTHEDIRANKAIADVERHINDNYLRALLFEDDTLYARLGIGADMTLAEVLERLELVLERPGDRERVPRGLGINNVLFMAAELLLLQSGDDQMPTLMIEEPEAHLHPQLQARFMQMLEERLTATQRPQVILTTHSPLLAAGADVDAMVLCRAGELYPLRRGVTKLDASDYAFLRRFLDSTKANLFFARGVLVVEGDAENLLLPVLADILGRSLTARGVSIVKVGHTGLFRYSRIFQRHDARMIPIPIACVGDRDIPPDEAKGLGGEKRPKKTKGDFTAEQIAAKEARLVRDAAAPVQVFIADHWTLEYDLALAGMAVQIHQATALAKRADPEDQSEEDARQEAEVLEACEAEVAGWRAEGLADAVIACRVYEAMYRKRVSKAQVAEQLAALLCRLPPDEVKTRVPPYLLAALEYATTPLLAAPVPSVQPTPPGST